MKICYKISIVGVMMLFVCSAYAGEKVAVLDFKSILAPAELGIAVAEILRTELIGLGDYTVIERGMLEQIFREQELQLTGAVDSETAVEIGKLVGAKLVVIGSIVKTGSVYTINSRFIDVETGVAKIGQNIRGQGEDQISLMVQQLALIITGKTVKTEDIMVSSHSLPDAKSETADTANQIGKPAIAPFIFDFEDQNDVKLWRPTNDDRHISIKQSPEHPTQGNHTLKAKLPKASSQNEYPGIYTSSFPPGLVTIQAVRSRIFTLNLRRRAKKIKVSPSYLPFGLMILTVLPMKTDFIGKTFDWNQGEMRSEFR